MDAMSIEDQPFVSVVDPADELWTTEQVAEVLGVAANTLYKWRRSGIVPLPYYKLGTHARAAIRYRKHEVLAYLAMSRHDNRGPSIYEEPRLTADDDKE